MPLDYLMLQRKFKKNATHAKGFIEKGIAREQDPIKQLSNTYRAMTIIDKLVIEYAQALNYAELLEHDSVCIIE